MFVCRTLVFTIFYTLMTSIETNECAASPSPCEHSCTNTDGSFQCSCNNGYLLDDDRRSCDGIYVLLNNYSVTTASKIAIFHR